jgi:hypothetical protein
MPRARKPASPFRYFNSSPEVIRLVVLMYVRFPLSLRNVEDLLFERGIDICHETVRLWWNRFGPMFAGDIRRQRVSRMRGFRHWRWHLDEMYVKLNGEMVYLWRAVDHEGGTAMAGIICADGSDGGMRGYAPGVHLRSYRVVPRIGSAVDIDVAVALTQAVEDGAELVCMPLSAPRTSPAPFAIQQALRFAADRGVICVLAAGNEGTDLGWPAAFREENCFAVGAYGMFDRVPADTTHADYVQDYPAARGCFLASFSNHAAEAFEHPDLLAPGVACVTTSPGGVGAISGTSAATAHVAGIAAVLLEIFPDDRVLPADQKIQRIRTRLLGIAESFSWGRAMEGWGQAMLR